MLKHTRRKQRVSLYSYSDILPSRNAALFLKQHFRALRMKSPHPHKRAVVGLINLVSQEKKVYSTLRPVCFLSGRARATSKRFGGIARAKVRTLQAEGLLLGLCKGS